MLPDVNPRGRALSSACAITYARIYYRMEEERIVLVTLGELAYPVALPLVRATM